MKRFLALICVAATVVLLLCGCSGNVCEHCGASTMAYNRVGDDVDGIQICNDCVDKMRMGKIRFNFTCDGCDQEKLGKKNPVVVNDEEKIICNTCYGYYQENGALPD